MEHGLDTGVIAAVAASALLWSLLSARLERLNISAPIAFVVLGLLFTHGPLALIDVRLHSSTARSIAEVTLALVLFVDASRINVRKLRADAGGTSQEDARTVAFIGWFGPRGLASVIFALLAVDTLDAPDANRVLAAVTVTVVLSVLAHGISASPFAARYGAAVSTLHPDRPEYLPTPDLPPRSLSGSRRRRDDAERW